MGFDWPDYYSVLLSTFHSLIRVTKTNLIHYLSSVYFVTQPLHVSGMFVAHHQEVYYIYYNRPTSEYLSSPPFLGSSSAITRSPVLIHVVVIANLGIQVNRTGG